MIIMLALIAGLVMGVYAGAVWTDYRVTTMADKHKKQMDEIFEEVKRCRAQIALHIGKEKE